MTKTTRMWRVVFFVLKQRFSLFNDILYEKTADDGLLMHHPLFFY